MGHIISVSNNKGGVGKTTISANLAHAIALKKKKVLLVDADSQGNLSSFFVPEGLPPERTLYGFLSDDSVHPKDIVYQCMDYERLYIIPNSKHTGALEPDLMRRPDMGWYIMRERLRDYAKENYDITIIDTPPNLGSFSLQAMIACDFVLVPVEASSKFSLDGLENTIEAIADIAGVEGPGNSGSLLRLVINMTDRRTVISKTSMAFIREVYGDLVCETVIPDNTGTKQAEHQGVTIIRHNASNVGAQAFRTLANEILSILG